MRTGSSAGIVSGVPAGLTASDQRACPRHRGHVRARASQRGLDGAPADFVAWDAQREGYRQAWRAFFHDWDVLHAPAKPPGCDAS